MAQFSMRAALVLAALCAVIASGSSPARGSFPGENGVLAFDAVDRDTQTVQIFQVSPGGTGLKQLTTTTGGVWNEDPVFSANGQTIYLSSQNRALEGPSRIYRMNANGTGRQLADADSPPTHFWPSVNGSGSRLALGQYLDSGQSVIITMEPDGSNRNLVAGATQQQAAGGPEYAPSGPRIVFYRVTYNGDGQGIAKSDLFIRRGTRNVNITSRSSAKFFGASWAPDGDALVALRGQRTLVSMKPNGTDVDVLASVTGEETGFVDAVYSPDGKKIAFLLCTGDCGDPDLQGQGSIWVMNADGSGKQRVFNGGNGVQPASRLSWGVD
jgi:Tol biopolymer transport system component